MKQVQISIINNDNKLLGTVLRTASMSDEELIMMSIQDEECVAIENGCIINIGTNWYVYDTTKETPVTNITGKSEMTTNTAAFSSHQIYDDAIASGIQLRDITKDTKILYAKTETTKDAAPEETVENINKAAKTKTKRRVFRGYHGQSKEKVTNGAQADLDFSQTGIAFVLNMLGEAGLVSLQATIRNLLYKDAKEGTVESVRGLAVKIEAELNKELEFYMGFKDAEKLSEVIALKAILNEDGTEKYPGKSVFGALIALLSWTHKHMDEFLKQWSGKEVFLPIRLLMTALKLIIEVVRTLGGVAFYVANGLISLGAAALDMLAVWAIGLIIKTAATIKGWFTKKEEPAVAAA